MIAKVALSTPRSAEAVFDAWTNEAAIRLWMPLALQAMGLSGQLTAIRTHPVPGGDFLFADSRAEGEARHFGRYMEIDRARRLSFTWYTDEGDVESTSLVCLDLKTTHETRGESMTWLSLEHMMDAEWKDYVEQTELGWRRLLEASCVDTTALRV